MKKYGILAAVAALALTLAACGANGGTNEPAASGGTNAGQQQAAEQPSGEAAEQASAPAEEQAAELTIDYLGKPYTFNNPVRNIVAASLESMEDAAVLGIKPVGVLEIAGEIPQYVAAELAGATLVGDKRSPNAEVILGLSPDAIVGTSKWGEETLAQMNKIATTLPYSHISTNWKANLLALGELAGKTAEAERIIADYEAKAADAKAKLGSSAAGKQVLVIRLRAGLMYIYPADVYLNPVLYEDLGLQVPEVVTNAGAQAELTLETLASVDPDVIFLQFEASENTDAPAALEELQANPIFASLKAAASGQVHVNTVAPLAQGGTAWSKVKFLDAAVDKLVQ